MFARCFSWPAAGTGNLFCAIGAHVFGLRTLIVWSKLTRVAVDLTRWFAPLLVKTLTGF